MLRGIAGKIVPVFAIVLLITASLHSDTQNLYSNTYLIPVPNPCVYVSRVEKGKIFLEEGENTCVQQYSIRQVVVEPSSDGLVEIYYKGKLWKKLKFKGNVEDLVESIFTSSIEGFSLNATGNVLQPGSALSPSERERIEKSISETKAYVESPEFQKKVEDFKKSLVSQLGISKEKEVSPSEYYERGVSGKGSILSPDERIYVFVSRSVPLEAVRAFVRDASLLGSENVIFVLRGGIGGLTYIRPTVEWIYSATVKDLSCSPFERRCELYPVRFQIDPFLFKRYGINEVPAIVYARGVKPEAGYSEGLSETEVGEFYVSYGDVSFFYHLYVIGKSSGNERFVKIAEKYLKY